MSLSEYKVAASIAVSDMAHAREFYEEKLGLTTVEEQPDGSRIYASGGGASLHVYPSPTHAGNATATLATWYATDLEQVVDELTSNGVVFEQYDEPPDDQREGGLRVRRCQGRLVQGPRPQYLRHRAVDSACENPKNRSIEVPLKDKNAVIYGVWVKGLKSSAPKPDDLTAEDPGTCRPTTHHQGGKRS